MWHILASFFLALIVGTIAAILGSMVFCGTTELAAIMTQTTMTSRLDWIVLIWMPTVLVFFTVFVYCAGEIAIHNLKKRLDLL